MNSLKRVQVHSYLNIKKIGFSFFLIVIIGCAISQKSFCQNLVRDKAYPLIDSMRYSPILAWDSGFIMFCEDVSRINQLAVNWYRSPYPFFSYQPCNKVPEVIERNGYNLDSLVLKRVLPQEIKHLTTDKDCLLDSQRFKSFSSILSLVIEGFDYAPAYLANIDNLKFVGTLYSQKPKKANLNNVIPQVKTLFVSFNFYKSHYAFSGIEELVLSINHNIPDLRPFPHLTIIHISGADYKKLVKRLNQCNSLKKVFIGHGGKNQFPIDQLKMLGKSKSIKEINYSFYDNIDDVTLKKLIEIKKYLNEIGIQIEFWTESRRPEGGMNYARILIP